jgi:hypothetical protein
VEHEDLRFEVKTSDISTKPGSSSISSTHVTNVMAQYI